MTPVFNGYTFMRNRQIFQMVLRLWIPGGLYAVVTDIDQKTDVASMKAEVDQFLSENGLERDPSRLELGNIITSPLAHEILGYEQMDYYTPVRKKNN